MNLRLPGRHVDLGDLPEARRRDAALGCAILSPERLAFDQVA